MLESQVTEYELEITSDCNAACPLCARTQMHMPLRGNNQFTLADIKKAFSRREQIEGKSFKLCGTMGDPIVHPHCFEICEYLSENGGLVDLSTNGGYNNVDWWKKLAQLPGLRVYWAVDGTEQTNHIYRVNVKWETLIRNMTAFSEAGGAGTWQYLIFDHNKDDVEEAFDLATSFGFKFKKRTSGRTKVYGNKGAAGENRVVSLNRKTKQEIKISDNSSGHSVSKANQARISANNVGKGRATEKDIQIIKQATRYMMCKHFDHPECYIGSDFTLWPCCFLYDTKVKNEFHYQNKNTLIGDPNWNSLHHHTIEEILATEQFQTIKQRWNPDNPKQLLERCIRTCGNKGEYLNTGTIIKKKKNI